jgi:hypothetical protein
MTIEPTTKSAALAGAWAVFGLVPLDAWQEHHKSISVLAYNLSFLAASAVFLFIPVYLFVIGPDSGPFSRAWFLSQEERSRYGVIVKRMFVWFLCAGAFGIVWSPLFGFVGVKIFWP